MIAKFYLSSRVHKSNYQAGLFKGKGGVNEGEGWHYPSLTPLLTRRSPEVGTIIRGAGKS